MSSLNSLEDSDSRTSSVGRKRGLDQLTTSDENVATIEDDTSGEDNQPLEKRARYNGAVEVDDNRLNSSTESFSDIISISDSPESGHFQQEEGRMTSEDVLMTTSGKADAGSAFEPPAAWDAGIPVTIHTSFTGHVPQMHSSSSQVGVGAQTSANSEIDTAAPSSNAPRAPSTKQFLDDHEIETAAATNNGSEEILDTRSKKERERDLKRLYRSEQKLGEKLEQKLERESKQKARMLKAEMKREIKRSKILDQLPSSFGTRAKQKEADRIIQGLPGASKGLMPREVANTAFNFSEMGRTFKLPRKLHKDVPVLHLAKLSFRDPNCGFIKAFLEENQSFLGFMDYKLLVRAFREYLGLLYGHLPDRLTSIVGSSKHVIGNKAESGCLRILDETKQAQTGLEKKKGLRQAKSRPKNLDRQSYDMIEKSQRPVPDAMGRMLETKHAQSQVTKSSQAEGESKIVVESSNEVLLMHSQEPTSKVILGTVHTSDQLDHDWKLATDNAIDVELIHRYHPSSDQYPLVHHCLTCGQTDHETLNCPSLTCATCGLHGIHFTDGCLKTQRCTKCHERGHRRSDCLEKLAATAHESLCCDICKSSKHLESACHFIWRSFKPGMLKTTRFVAEIPVHCYSCGAAGHFGSVCGVRHSPLNTEGYSWSTDNLRRYVDPASHNRALSAGKDFSLPLATKAKKTYNIRGSAQNGTSASNDDDENIPFIQEKVSRPTRPIPRGNQHIKFEQHHQRDNDYTPRSHLGSPVPASRYQPSRAVGPVPQSYTEDGPHLSYRTRNDSARHMHERSFSPPPRFPEERHPLVPGDNYYQMNDRFDTYRPYERRISDSNTATRVREVRGDSAQGVRGGPEGLRGKRNR